MEFVDIKEDERIYHFPGGHSFKIKNVVKFANSESTHRLEDVKGNKYIIPKSFIAISLLGEWVL
jgi:hypothetical protein